MKLFVYADESGTFDSSHYDWFTYGGVMCCGLEAMQEMARRYAGLEAKLRGEDESLACSDELKAKYLDFHNRKRLYNSLSIPGVHRFGVIVNQAKVFPNIYGDQRSRQRFIDYALKRAIKESIRCALAHEGVPLSAIDFVKVTVDEHTSKTNGRYTLEESIDEELRHGMFRLDFSGYAYPPLFPQMKNRIQTHYANSRNVGLVRAPDIVANWLYNAVKDRNDRPDVLRSCEDSCNIIWLH